MRAMRAQRAAVVTLPAHVLEGEVAFDHLVGDRCPAPHPEIDLAELRQFPHAGPQLLGLGRQAGGQVGLAHVGRAHAGAQIGLDLDAAHVALGGDLPQQGVGRAVGPAGLEHQAVAHVAPPLIDQGFEMAPRIRAPHQHAVEKGMQRRLQAAVCQRQVAAGLGRQQRAQLPPPRVAGLDHGQHDLPFRVEMAHHRQQELRRQVGIGLQRLFVQRAPGGDLGRPEILQPQAAKLQVRLVHPLRRDPLDGFQIVVHAGPGLSVST